MNESIAPWVPFLLTKNFIEHELAQPKEEMQKLDKDVERLNGSIFNIYQSLRGLGKRIFEYSNTFKDSQEDTRNQFARAQHGLAEVATFNKSLGDRVSKNNELLFNLGCMAYMRLTNGLVFSFHTETNKTEVWSFHRSIKTYYELDNPPKEKIEALKALNLQNKLNKKSAALLAAKYLKLLGHKEENFHPLGFFDSQVTQGYWVNAPESPPANERNLPYYRVIWYRRDVKLEDLKNHDSNAELKSGDH